MTKPNPYANDIAMSPELAAAESARFMGRVYAWMAGGIAVSGGIAYTVAQDEALAYSIVQNRMIFWALIIAQFGAVIALSTMIRKINSLAAAGLYLGYAALTGLTFSTIFMVYRMDSIASAFFMTSFGFAGLSAVGYFTKKDLGPVGSFCYMGLFGMIGYMLISFIFPGLGGGQGRMIMSIVGLIVFAGLTAYDTQKIKAMNILGNEGTDEDRKEAIYGALTLYLDFINLFLIILRLTGRRR